MFRSATFKLTMWYLAIAMAISLLFSIALYDVTTNQLRQGLRSESQSLYSQFPVFQGDPHVNFGSAPYYEDSSHRILLRLVAFNVLVLFAAGFSSYWLARRTLEPIQEAHEQQKRFTADVSHELRTPLTAIRMESEVALMNDKIPAKELKQTLNSNLEEVEKLELLINSLLRLTRLDQGELQQNFVKLKSKTIVAEAVERVAKSAKNQSIKIEKPSSDAELTGDQDSLVQLLTILLDNAIKYSPKGSTIEISTINGKENVIWRIVDQGIGIEPDALEHIFDRFYRADSSRGKSVEGFGLGLSIGKAIADVHNGNIVISSQVGEGTTVSVNIPKNIMPKSLKA